MNGMKWFRVYSEIKDDPKILEMDDHQRWLWICLLAMASESTDRGVISGVRLRGLAASLRTDESRLADTLSLLVDLEMIDYDESSRTIEITHWNERQYDKPSDTPAALRDRKRKSRQSHADVTPSHAIEEIRIDTDTDTDNTADTVVSAAEPPEPPPTRDDEKPGRVPKQKPDVGALVFDPVQDFVLVELLTAHYDSTGKRPPAKFQNAAQRDGYRMAAEFLGPDTTRKAITQCIVGNRYAIGQIVTSLLRWVDNEKRGGVARQNGQQPNEPRGYAALRRVAKELFPNGV